MAAEISSFTASSQREMTPKSASRDARRNEESGSDSSLVPDGDQYVEVIGSWSAAALPDDGMGSVRSTSSVISQTGFVKPVEEITYG